MEASKGGTCTYLARKWLWSRCMQNAWILPRLVDPITTPKKHSTPHPKWEHEILLVCVNRIRNGSIEGLRSEPLAKMVTSQPPSSPLRTPPTPFSATPLLKGPFAVCHTLHCCRLGPLLTTQHYWRRGGGGPAPPPPPGPTHPPPLSDGAKSLEERLLDQAQAPTPYGPPFLGVIRVAHPKA